MNLPLHIILSMLSAASFVAQGQIAQPAPHPMESTVSEVQLAITRILVAVRTTDDRQLVKLLAPISSALSPERITTLSLLNELRERLRPPVEPPMSEMSAPLLLVRGIALDGPERATACIYVVRAGSLLTSVLAAYHAAVTSVRKEWRLASLSRKGHCQPLGDTLPVIQ